MAHQGPSVPHRTLRKEALSKGTAAGSLVDNDEGYSPQAGSPEALTGAKDEYYDEARDKGYATPAAAQPRPMSAPFKVK